MLGCARILSAGISVAGVGDGERVVGPEETVTPPMTVRLSGAVIEGLPAEAIGGGNRQGGRVGDAVARVRGGW